MNYRLGVLLAIGTLVFAACGGSTPPAAATQTAVQTQAAQSAAPTAETVQTLKIGYIADLAGSFQVYGYPNLNGMLVVADMINEKGGIRVGGQRYNVALEICRSDSEATQALSCARELVQNKGVKIVMGALGGQGPGVAAFVDANGGLHINAGSAVANRITEYKNVFSTIADPDINVALVVAGVKKAYPSAKTIAFLTANQPIGEQLPSIVKAFEGAGFTVVSNDKYDQKAVDLTPQLSKVKSLNPDVLFLGWTVADTALPIKTAKQISAAKNLYAWATSCDQVQPEIGSTDIKYVGNLLTGVDINAPTTELAKSYVAKYKTYITSSQYQSPSNTQNMYASLFWADSLFVVAKAMEAAGTTTDVPKITEQMLKTRVEAVQGPGYGFSAKKLGIVGTVHCTLNLDGPGKTNAFYLPPPAR